MYGLDEFPHGRNWDSDLRQIIALFLKLKDLPEEWEKFQQDMQEDFENLSQSVKDMFTEYQDALEKAWASYQNLMNSKWSDYQTQLNQAWADFQVLMDKNQKLYENQLTAKWADYQTEIDNRFDQYTSGLTTQFTNFSTQMTQRQTSFEASVDSRFIDYTTQQQAAWDSWQTVHESLWQAYKTVTDAKITALETTVGGYDGRIKMAEDKVAGVVGWCKWLDYMVEIAYVWNFENNAVDIPEGTTNFNVHLNDYPDTVKRGVYYLQFASIVSDNGGAWSKSIETDVIVPVYGQFPVGIEQRLIGHVPLFDQNAHTVGTILVYVDAKFSDNIIKDDYKISVQVLTLPNYTRINNRKWGIRLLNMALLGVGMTYNGGAIPPYNPVE